MTTTLIPIKIKKIMRQPSYTSMVVGTEEKSFAIYAAPHVGKNIQECLSDGPLKRPYTYDLLSNMCAHLDIKILQVVLSDVEEGIYSARLFVEQKKEELTHILEIDARPSDCLILAIKEEIPILCTQELLDKAIAFEE